MKDYAHSICKFWSQFSSEFYRDDSYRFEKLTIISAKSSSFAPGSVILLSKLLITFMPDQGRRLLTDDFCF